MTTPAVLAIDAGQTGMKTRLVTPAGGRDAVFPGILTAAPLRPQLVAVVRAALSQSDAEAVTVTAGVSGLTAGESDASALLEAIDTPHVREVRLAHDSITSFLGALGDGRGAVVASGTGVVTLGVGPSRVARVDGWGWIMGDAGSGYWIGREALDAAMRDFDGRGARTALRARVEARWPDLASAYIDLQADPDRVAVVASFAAEVARAADEGDEIARRISARAGTELALSVETALRRAQAGSGAEVCAIGGVLRSRWVRDAFSARIGASDLDATAVSARGDGLDGAVTLARLGAQHPLFAAVSVARA
ncbi:N-acetylglucosamine kinase [Microbacterium sp. NPDC057407]|uniref:N-acetylglucosamine kinase n=1 Tax=Microbacterium sp. NPDC057407 TaxID=3346120 RepID=UPI00366D4760